MTQNKETYLLQRRAQIAEIQRKICDLLGWDELAYGNCMYQGGLEYIRRYYRAAELVQCVERSRAFWNWWKVIWWNTDENMLTFVFPAGFCRQRAYELYCHLHNVEPLLDEILPPRHVWEDIKNIQRQAQWA